MKTVKDLIEYLYTLPQDAFLASQEIDCSCDGRKDYYYHSCDSFSYTPTQVKKYDFSKPKCERVTMVDAIFLELE